MTRKTTVGRFLLAGLLVLAVPVAAMAAGSRSTSRPPAPVSSPSNDYDLAVRAVRAGDYPRALTLLQNVVQRISSSRISVFGRLAKYSRKRGSICS